MRSSTILLSILLAASLAYGRSLASIRKDAFTIGVKSDTAAEYDFISEITKKMKFSRFRLVSFENANAGERLLLSGKIDVIIAKINYAPHLESKFLVSLPYAQTEITLALPASNQEIWTLNDLSGKTLAFLPQEVSSEQIRNLLPNAKLIAARTLNEALDLLQRGEAKAIIANRKTLETEASTLRTLPNKLAENNTVALFAPGSKALRDAFNKAIESEARPITPPLATLPRGELSSDNKQRILQLLDELKKEIEILQRELK
ncbi:MAG: transporter substrate-binding domain-containing protein [Fibromonadaceae bacterium]|jgi:ABC-type amino acid transport substrate-binding protein|nr:transporter substrate-binding domain-containing protein [Fibromonadaceae bacterium]